MSQAEETQDGRLRELAGLFLRLGTTAFGGPAAHIAMMEEEVVRRRAWLSRQEFLDLVGATNLIPGPNSTELAIHVGHRRAGWRGLLVAGICFILPAAIIVLAIAWGYQRYGAVPQAAGVLYAVKPVIIAVVAQALWRLLRSAVKTPFLAAVGAAAVAASVAGVHELILLGAAAVITWIGQVVRGSRGSRGAAAACVAPIAGVLGARATPVRAGETAAGVIAAGGAAAGAGASVGLWAIFAFFAKVGSVLFGSGYVLLAFLRADLVERHRWLTEAQLLDAIAVGQITPGPVFTTATFIGYLLSGWQGAIVATVGIFLPAFFFVAISAPFVARLRASAGAGALLDGLNVASLALLAVVAWHLGRAALVDVPTVAIGVVAAVLILRFNVNSAWLVLASGLGGLLFS